MAGRALERVKTQAEAKLKKDDTDYRTKEKIHKQELAHLDDIVAEIKKCKIYAPHAGMVVYFKNESSRFSSTPTGLIEQGAQVKEGQKLLRIPKAKVDTLRAAGVV